MNNKKNKDFSAFAAAVAAELTQDEMNMVSGGYGSYECTDGDPTPCTDGGCGPGESTISWCEEGQCMYECWPED